MAEYIESKCGFCVHLGACAAWIRHGSALYSDFSYSVADCPHYLSAADVVEVVHGTWGKPFKVDADNVGYACSACGYHGVPCWNFCPNCGAKLEG